MNRIPFVHKTGERLDYDQQETGLKSLVTPRTKNRLANSKAPTDDTNDFSNEIWTFQLARDNAQPSAHLR